MWSTLGTIAKAIGFGAKRIPVIGAVVTGIVALGYTGYEMAQGNFKKAAAEFTAGVAETAGNFVGFGVGDAARQLAVEGIDATTDVRARDSFVVAAVKDGFGLNDDKEPKELTESAKKQEEKKQALPKTTSVFSFLAMPAFGGLHAIGAVFSGWFGGNNEADAVNTPTTTQLAQNTQNNTDVTSVNVPNDLKLGKVAEGNVPNKGIDARDPKSAAIG